MRDFRRAVRRRAGAVQSSPPDSRRHRTASRQPDSSGVLVPLRAGRRVGIRDRKHDWRFFRRGLARRHLRLLREPGLRMDSVQSLGTDRPRPESDQPLSVGNSQVRHRMPRRERALRRPGRMGRQRARHPAVRDAGQRDHLQQHDLGAGALAVHPRGGLSAREKRPDALHRRDAGGETEAGADSRHRFRAADSGRGWRLDFWKFAFDRILGAEVSARVDDRRSVRQAGPDNRRPVSVVGVRGPVHDVKIFSVNTNQHSVWAEGVTFTYHGADRPALRGVSLVQNAGEMIGVMGASGAGKSTLAKCLNRIVPEFEDGEFHGAIQIAGESLDVLRVCDLAPKVEMVFQDFESQLFSTNVAHEVAFAMEQVGMDRAEMDRRILPALEAVGLRGFDHRDPMSLSGGEKQRLAIASVLALRPSVIVLDEPTTDLDPEGRAEVFELIAKLRAQGLSLIVIEHESEELRAADRIVVLREGEIAANGPPFEVFARTELLTACGVRPPGLGHALELLGIDAQPKSVEQAYDAIARAYPRVVGTVHENVARSRPHEQPASVDAVTASSAFIGIENVSFSY